jgi:hypothetical protein
VVDFLHNSLVLLSLSKERHLSKIQKGRHKQRSGQHTLVRKKYHLCFETLLILMGKCKSIREIHFYNTLQHKGIIFFFFFFYYQCCKIFCKQVISRYTFLLKQGQNKLNYTANRFNGTRSTCSRISFSQTCLCISLSHACLCFSLSLTALTPLTREIHKIQKSWLIISTLMIWKSAVVSWIGYLLKIRF